MGCIKPIIIQSPLVCPDNVQDVSQLMCDHLCLEPDLVAAANVVSVVLSGFRCSEARYFATEVRKKYQEDQCKVH